MIHSIRFFVAFLLFASMVSCHNSTSPTEVTDTPTPFSFHKPRLGATFTIEATIQNSDTITSDTTFVYRVADTNAAQDGRSGVSAISGYYFPFWVSYSSTGDIYVWGNSDFIFGRNDWTWYPLSHSPGAKLQTYYHDSIISNPDPNDTRAVTTDIFSVVGNETLMIKGQPVECIKGVLTETYTLTNLQFNFTITSTESVAYWYAPSIGYWAKVQSGLGPDEYTFRLTDYSL
jgi:hypothetical protein